MLLVQSQRHTTLKIWHRRGVVLVLFLVFLGSLTMHSATFTSSPDAIIHSHSVTSLPLAGASDTLSSHAETHPKTNTHFAQDRACSDNSCFPNSAPLELMQIMSCVAALIALALALLIPVLKTRYGTLIQLKQAQVLNAPDQSQLHLCPSLISLSISRT